MTVERMRLTRSSSTATSGRLVDRPEQTAAEQMLDRWTSLLDDRYTGRNATVTVWRAV